MAKGSGTTKSVGSGNASSSRTSTYTISPEQMMNFTPKVYQKITGMNYYRATENVITDALDIIKDTPSDMRLYTGYRVETVRKVLLTRLVQLRKLNKK